jgi:hypothetical protein
MQARDGLEAAAKHQLLHVIPQTDCSVLVSLWHDEEHVRKKGVHILNELKKLRVSWLLERFLYICEDFLLEAIMNWIKFKIMFYI